MPDDASPPLRTSDSDHAHNLREERRLMRAGGISRSQARAALAGYAKERMESEAVKALAGIPKQATDPIISSETQSFNPQPLTLGEIPGAGAGGSPGVAPQVLNKTGVFVIESGGTFSVETLDFYGE